MFRVSFIPAPVGLQRAECNSKINTEFFVCYTYVSPIRVSESMPRRGYKTQVELRKTSRE